MTRIFVIIFLLFQLIFTNCNNKKSDVDNHSIIGPKNILLDDSIKTILKSFIKYHESDEEIVYQLFIDQEPDSVVLYLSYAEYISEIEKYIPSGLIKMGNNLFLIYSGSTSIFKIDSLFEEKLRREISNIKLKNSTERPKLREHKTWRIIVDLKGNIRRIDWINLCPYNNYIDLFFRQL